MSRFSEVPTRRLIWLPTLENFIDKERRNAITQFWAKAKSLYHASTFLAVYRVHYMLHSARLPELLSNWPAPERTYYCWLKSSSHIALRRCKLGFTFFGLQL